MACLCIIALLVGCSEITPYSSEQGTYATQQRTTALEYNLYIGKQINVFTNQLMSRITILQGEETMSYPNEKKLAESSLREMKETLDSVKGVFPSIGDDANRDMTIECMQITIDDMERYIKDIDSGASLSKYKAVFQNDFNALTQQAGLYNQ